MEWKNPYSSFNSQKGLAYTPQYRQIVAWLNGKGKLPPPVECNLDPIAECNLKCYFCITQRYLRNHREEVETRKLPLDYMIRLVDFLAEWGVKGLCISGGGEPSLHEDIPEVIIHAHEMGLDVAFVTNATNINAELREALMLCRWVALSVDAASGKTYATIKGTDRFDLVKKNIASLANFRHQVGASVDLCFKFLLLPENQSEIYDACKLAKSLGVQDFHVRPVDFERSDINGAKPLTYDLPAIYAQFQQCHEEEKLDFHVYTVTHKFDSEFHVKHDFSRCLAAPLILPALTDGNGYICVEHKMESKYRLGSCYPDPESILNWWGSDFHREMIKGIVPQSHCSRCIYSEYQHQIEEAVIKDRMCLSFP